MPSFFNVFVNEFELTRGLDLAQRQLPLCFRD